MNSQDRSLPGFERRLLGELEQVVAEEARPPAPERPAARPLGFPRTAWFGLAAALVGGAVLVAPTGLTGAGSPAFAVERQEDGAVEVEIRDFRDEEELERELDAHGVPATVDYSSDGEECQRTRVPLENGTVQGSPEDDAGLGDPENGTIRINPEDGTFRIAPERLADGERLLVRRVSPGETSVGEEVRTLVTIVGEDGECGPTGFGARITSGASEDATEPTAGHDGDATG